jgi:uncharacterized protein
MPGRVLIAHSSGPQGPGEGSSSFVQRLREGLGPEYEVLLPLMPSPEDPHYRPWSEHLAELLEVDGPVIVLGHSLGGSVAVKHLAEGGTGGQMTGLIMVAAPFWGTADWEAEWALPEDWPGGESELPPIFLFHSRDDEEISVDHLGRYAERLPDATVQVLDGNGHLYDRGDLTPILNAVRGLSGS